VPESQFPTNVTLATGEVVHGRILLFEAPGWPQAAMAVSTEPLRGVEGAVTMVVTRWSDVTAHRSAAEQLRQAQKMELVGNLAGGIAHDFNNLLTAITLTVELFGMRNSSSPEAVTLVSKLRGLTQRAAAMTGQLLVFSAGQRRRSAGSKPTSASPISFRCCGRCSANASRWKRIFWPTRSGWTATRA
jgi:signal transduction histidine kinase